MRDDDLEDEFEYYDNKIIFDSDSVFIATYDMTKSSNITLFGKMLMIKHHRNIYLHPNKSNRKKIALYKRFGIWTEKTNDYHNFSFGIENNIHKIEYTKIIEKHGISKLKKYYIEGCLDSIEGIFEIFVLGRTCIHRFFRPKIN